jgi:hypothetical protein
MALTPAQRRTPRTRQRTVNYEEPLWGAQAVLAVSEEFAEIYRNAGVPNVLAVPNGVSRLPEIRRIPAPDHRVRLGQIGGMARHKGFHLIKYALMASEFDGGGYHKHAGDTLIIEPTIIQSCVAARRSCLGAARKWKL